LRKLKEKQCTQGVLLDSFRAIIIDFHEEKTEIIRPNQRWHPNKEIAETLSLSQNRTIATPGRYPCKNLG